MKCFYTCFTGTAVYQKDHDFTSFSSIQQNGLFQTQTQTSIGTAERKILLVFVYYILVGVLVLTGFSLGISTGDEKYKATVEYLQCEANGHNNTCEYDPPHYPAITLIINVLLGLFPAIILVFAVNVREMKAVSKHTIKKLSKTFSSITSTIETDVITTL